MNDRLAEYVADKSGISSATLESRLGLATPGFSDSEYLDEIIIDGWNQMPIEAKLLAFLLATERASEDSRKREA